MAAEKDRQAPEKTCFGRALSQLKAVGQNGRGEGPSGPEKTGFGLGAESA